MRMADSETRTASENGEEVRNQDNPAGQNAAAVMTDQDESPPVQVRHREVEEEAEVFEDASDHGEIQFRRREVEYQHQPRHNHHHMHQMVSTHPHIKPEEYDGTSDWSEYLIYFEQLSELYAWEDEVKAAMLSVSLKGEARVVLAGLDAAKRRSYFALTNALAQSFSPKELVHLHQAELKARRRKPEESMVDLGRDIAKLVRLAYPTADTATREVIGINSFLEALPGPASEMKLHVIKGRPRNLQEAVAHATEVDAVMEAENKRSSRRRGDVRMLEPEEEDIQKELESVQTELKKLLEETKQELHGARGQYDKRRGGKRPLKDVTCYGCGERGHYRKGCPNVRNQGNEPRRLDRQ